MNHLDFTIDFETCAMSANAAPMQVAMVPWARYNETDPFLFEDGDTAPYVGYVDLRTCVVDGFDFDQETVRWWAGRSNKAKEAVCKGEPDSVDNVLIGLLDYIRGMRAKYQLTSVCLWCQGMDLDIAILRNLCRKYGVNLEEDIPHTSFRDCRTVILEAALKRASSSKFLRPDGSKRPEVERQVPSERPETCNLQPETILAGSYDVYKMFAPLPERYANGSEAHDALYDALRSSWNTWQALKWITNG